MTAMKTTKSASLIKEISYFFRNKHKLKIEKQDKLAWTIIGSNIKLTKFAKMYNGFHNRYKYRFLKPMLYIGMWLMAHSHKKVIGSSFIPPEKLEKIECNKILNICTATMDQTIRESALILNKNVDAYKHPENDATSKQIKLMYDVAMQSIIYDTYYRGIFEMYVLNLTVNMNKAYGKNTKHLLYSNKSLHDVEYLMGTQRNDGSYFVIDEKDHLIVVPKGAAIRIEKQKIQDILNKQEKNKGVFQ